MANTDKDSSGWSDSVDTLLAAPPPFLLMFVGRRREDRAGRGSERSTATCQPASEIRNTPLFWIIIQTFALEAYFEFENALSKTDIVVTETYFGILSMLA